MLTSLMILIHKICDYFKLCNSFIYLWLRKMWCLTGLSKDAMEDSMEVLKELVKENSDVIPNIYINDALLKSMNGVPDYKKTRGRHKRTMYEVNGTTFEDIQEECEDEYAEFEIVGESVGIGGSLERERKFWQNAVAEFGGGNKDTVLLALTIQETLNGVIINSNVFLTEEKWHTLMKIENDHMFCVVCSTVCPLDYRDHIDSDDHRTSLQDHLPLDYFDLNIMRKVDGKYHCGVCNIVIPTAQIDHHLSSKPHEEYLLTAINKVSDISDYESPQDGQSVSGPEDDILEGFYDYNYSPTTNGYSVGTDDSDDASDSPTYASMVSTPKKTPKYIEIDLGKKKAWVQMDTWHMILTPKPSKFYCMVCKTEGQIRKKIDHCSRTLHLENLAKCTLVKKYSHHLVRTVDNRFLHCGHCNNLRLASDIEGHLEFRHPISKSKNLIDPEKVKTQKTTKTNGVSASMVTGVGLVQANTSNIPATVQIPSNCRYNTNTVLRTPIFDVNTVVQVTLFGTRMVVSLLSLNMVLMGNGFHCCLCEETLTLETISKHLESYKHVEIMKKAPFIPNLNCNLIRVIRDGFHCAICNVAIPYNIIVDHIRHFIHVSMLNSAIIVPIIPLVRPEPSPSVPLLSNNQFSILNEVSDNPNPVNVPKEIESNDISQDIDQTAESAETRTEIEEEVVEEPFDVEDFVYVKIDNTLIKISICAYNTLVSLGDGTRHCFLCSENLAMDKLGEHIRRREHLENMEKNKFLDKWKTSLIRQQYVTYHCGVCNVLVVSRDLNLHMTWSVHIHQEESSGNIKKEKNIEEKKQYDLTMQKEIIYTDAAEPKMKIVKSFKFSKETTKKYKMVIIKDLVARIEWHSWHSFRKSKTDYRCCVCQKSAGGDLIGHSKIPEHIAATKNIIRSFLPALVRQTKGDKMHCATCNMELNEHTIDNHILTDNHQKIYKSILKKSSQAESFADCSPDVFGIDEK